MANLFGGVLSVVLSVILVANIVIPTVKNTSTTNWTTSEIAVFGLVSLISLFGLVYGAGSVFGIF